MSVAVLAPPAVVAIPTVAEDRFLLPHVGWACYEAILAGVGDGRSIRVTYDRGSVELMSPRYEHEGFGAVLGLLVMALGAELRIKVKSGRSTTFRRQDRDRGLEPDQCFWIANFQAMVGRETHDMRTDPPPDLAIEVEITRSALDRMGIYADLGVAEVWRFDGTTLFVHRLRPDGAYECIGASPTFPRLPLAEVPPLLHPNRTADDNEALDNLRAWVRQRIVANDPPPASADL